MKLALWWDLLCWDFAIVGIGHVEFVYYKLIIVRIKRHLLKGPVVIIYFVTIVIFAL